MSLILPVGSNGIVPLASTKFNQSFQKLASDGNASVVNLEVPEEKADHMRITFRSTCYQIERALIEALITSQSTLNNIPVKQRIQAMPSGVVMSRSKTSLNMTSNVNGSVLNRSFSNISLTPSRDPNNGIVNHRKTRRVSSAFVRPAGKCASNIILHL
jgi:hypothetical protein